MVCPEENKLSGQDWGPEGLRRPQQSPWEKSVPCWGTLGKVPGLRLRRSGIGRVGWVVQLGPLEWTKGEDVQEGLQGETGMARESAGGGSSEVMAGKRQWSSEPHPVQR